MEIEITKLLVKCPYHIAGCSWHGRFKDSAVSVKLVIL